MSEKFDFSFADPLSDAFDVSSIRGRVYCYCEFSSPWALSLPSVDSAYFHVVERGGGWLKLADGQVFSLAVGDLILILKGNGHVIYDSRETAPIDLTAFLEDGGAKVIKYGGGGAPTHLVCGEFVFDAAGGNPLFAVLPAVIHLQSSARPNDWLESALRLLAYEARHVNAGATVLINRLTEIIFIQTVRAWANNQPPAQSGWLGALQDKQIGAALELIHKNFAAKWSVATLAKEIGMSRSKFAARFRQLIGEAPLTYLTKWRMQIAVRLLREENATVASAAQAVGYNSETAFSKVFKQQFGNSPSSFRRRKQVK